MVNKKCINVISANLNIKSLFSFIFFIAIVSFSSIYILSMENTDSSVFKGCSNITGCKLEDIDASHKSSNYNVILSDGASNCDSCVVCNALRKGADINSIDALGYSVLYNAVDNKCIEVINILLKNKAEINESIVRLAAKRGVLNLFEDYIDVDAYRRKSIRIENRNNWSPRGRSYRSDRSGRSERRNRSDRSNRLERSRDRRNERQADNQRIVEEPSFDSLRDIVGG